MKDAGTTFAQRLSTAWQRFDSLLCVGIDPDANALPAEFAATPAGLLAYGKALVDATAPYACTYKPQFAYFAALGAEAELAQLIDYIRQTCPDQPVILDAKRGDIGATAHQYAREAFVRYNADAVTVNPYMGMDTVTPYADPAWAGRGVIVLCRTSNPGAAEFQEMNEVIPPPYLRVAAAIAKLNAAGTGAGAYGLVAGATVSSALQAIRQTVGNDLPLLVPGIGAQGGNLQATLLAGLNAAQTGLLINVSRSIGQITKAADWQKRAAQAAQDYQQQIQVGRQFHQQQHCRP